MVSASAGWRAATSRGMASEFWANTSFGPRLRAAAEAGGVFGSSRSRGSKESMVVICAPGLAGVAGGDAACGSALALAGVTGLELTVGDRSVTVVTLLARFALAFSTSIPGSGVL